jgi:hypothetical protein
MVQSKTRKLGQNALHPSFLCPLSYRIMEEPVSDLCAHTFERTAIESWIARGNTCCPISRKSLQLEDLKANHVLAERIEKWKWEQEHHEDLMILKSGLTVSSEDDDDNLEGDAIMKVEGDIEMGGHVVPKKGFKKSSYQTIPSDMMFLPQEREVLERRRRRNKDIRTHRRRRGYCYCVVGSVLILTALVTALWLYSGYYLENEDYYDDDSV